MGAGSGLSGQGPRARLMRDGRVLSGCGIGERTYFGLGFSMRARQGVTLRYQIPCHEPGPVVRLGNSGMIQPYRA